jgi:hypothetical protein
VRVVAIELAGGDRIREFLRVRGENPLAGLGMNVDKGDLMFGEGPKHQATGVDPVFGQRTALESRYVVAADGSDKAGGNAETGGGRHSGTRGTAALERESVHYAALFPGRHIPARHYDIETP